MAPTNALSVIVLFNDNAKELNLSQTYLLIDNEYQDDDEKFSI